VGAALRRRPLDRLEQPQPLACRRRAEDAARAVDDGGDTRFVESIADQRRSAVGVHEDGDVARAHALATEARTLARAALDLGTRGQQRDEVGREVRGDVLAGTGQDRVPLGRK